MTDRNFKYHLFISHSVADSDIAQQLYFSLNQFYKVFCDLETLEPGDRWDETIAQAQRESLITVVLISPNTEPSYYQHEEIAIGLELSRQRKRTHRVIPVYVNLDSPPEYVPFGLKRLTGIYLNDWVDINKVSKKIRKLLNDLENEILIGDSRVLSLLSAFHYGRKNVIASFKQRFHNAFKEVHTPYLSDFFCSLAEKNNEGEFIEELEEISRIQRKEDAPQYGLYGC